MRRLTSSSALYAPRALHRWATTAPAATLLQRLRAVAPGQEAKFLAEHELSFRPAKDNFAAYCAVRTEARDAATLLMRLYGSTGRPDAARDIFFAALRDLPREDVTPALFAALLQLLAQQPAVSHAEVSYLWRLMTVDFGLAPTGAAYQALVELHLRLYCDPAPLWFELRARGVAPTRTLVRLLAAGAIPQHGDMTFVLDVLQAYIAGEAAVGASSSAAPVRSVGIDRPQLHAFFTKLVAHPQAAPEHATWLLFELEKQCLGDGVSLKRAVERTALVELLLKCARAGDAATTERVLAVFDRHLMPKTVDVMALALWAYAVAQEVEKAIDVCEEMARRGMLEHLDHTSRFVVEAINLPLEKHFLAILGESLATTEAVDRAYFHLERRHKAGMPVSVHAMDVVVVACGRIGDEARALETMDAYAAFGVQHRTQSYNALLLSCAGRGKSRQHRVVFEDMRRRGVRPNHHTLRLLIRQAVACDHIEEALEFLEAAPTLPGVRLEIEMILPILERGAKVGDADTVLQLCRFALDSDIGIASAILTTAVERLRDFGADTAAIEALIPVHEKLRGRYGTGRRMVVPNAKQQ